MPGPRHTGSCARHSARRPQVAVCHLLSAAIVSALVVSATPADASDGIVTIVTESELYRSVRQGLDRHPSIMLAGVVALTVPMVALVAAVLRLMARWKERRAPHLAAPTESAILHRSAWIEVPGRRARPVAIGEIVRIGNSDDCDLTISGAAPGGTCALIQRTSDYEFILFNVSAGEASLAVNGAPSDRCQLADGDRIEIGSARLVFRTGDRMPASFSTRGA